MNYQQFNHFNHAKLIEIYKALVTPRMIEEKMLKLLRQGQVSKWLKVLDPLLQNALKKLGVQPARNANDLVRMFEIRQDENNPLDKPKARTISADATDRPIGRSTDYETKRTIILVNIINME